MVPRSVALLALTASLLAAFPTASAGSQQTFYYASGLSLSLEPGSGVREPVSESVGACVVVCAGASNAVFFETELTQPGTVIPQSSQLWLEVTQSAVSASTCPVAVYVQLLDSEGEHKWYWSVCADMEPVTDAGTYEVEFDWPSDYTPQDAEPGDTLRATVWVATHPAAPDSMYLLGDAEHPSQLVMSGTNEPMPGQEPGEGPEPGQNATAPAPSGSGGPAPAPSGPSPSGAPRPPSAGRDPQHVGGEDVEGGQEDAKTSPGVGVAVLAALALAGVVVRRRL